MNSVCVLQQRIHSGAHVGIHVYGVDDANVGMLLDQILKRHAHVFLVRTPGFPISTRRKLLSGMPAKGVFSQECGGTLKAARYQLLYFP